MGGVSCLLVRVIMTVIRNVTRQRQALGILSHEDSGREGQREEHKCRDGTQRGSVGYIHLSAGGI